MVMVRLLKYVKEFSMIITFVKVFLNYGVSYFPFLLPFLSLFFPVSGMLRLFFF